jgi:hypothetical protein
MFRNRYVLSFVTGALVSVPVEYISYTQGSVEYPDSWFVVPLIDFPLTGILFYGIYALALVWLFDLLKSQLEKVISIPIFVLTLSFLLASNLGLVMEKLALISGYMVYTEKLVAHHKDVADYMPVALSLYLYYSFMINLPILLLTLLLDGLSKKK